MRKGRRGHAAMGAFLAAWLLGAPIARAAQVGIFAADVTPPDGVPLAGFFDRRREIPDYFGLDLYSHWFEPSAGVRADDGIRAKAFALETASGGRLVLVSVDLVAVPRDLRSAILAKLAALAGLGTLPAFAPEEVVLTATHTHSGPGTLTQNWLFERTSGDRFEPTIRNVFATKVAGVVASAWNARKAATLHAFSVEILDVAQNRSDNTRPLHERANVMLVRTGSRWAGALVGFPVHGTVLGKDNLEYSADLPGAIERGLQVDLATRNGDGLPTTVLFLNGAEGDAAPKHHGENALALLSSRVVSKVAAEIASCGAGSACPSSWQVGADVLAVEHANVPLGTAFVYARKKVWGVLAPLFWWQLGLTLGWTLPHDAPITSIRLGDQYFLTWPGEPTAALGRAVANAACAKGARLPWVVGLADDHLAYFTTPKEFFGSDGTAESSSLYGPYAGRRIVNAHCRLLNPP